jgi:RNA polymerase sigma factor (sigma-70 family)
MAPIKGFDPLARAALRVQPDARLVALAREGREAAFEEIVRRYRPALVAFAAAYSPPAIAEDVVQESLVRSWQALRESTGEIRLRPWLYTIVRNRALNARRDARSHAELDENHDGVPQPPEIVLTQEELERAVASVRALPEAQREALVRSAIDGRAHDQIAAELGTSVGAIRQLIYRARATLRHAAGLVIPLPLLRALIEIDAAQAGAAAAGGGGAAAGAIAAAGGGSAGAKGLAVVAAAVAAAGSGIAIERAVDGGGSNRSGAQEQSAASTGGSEGDGQQAFEPASTGTGSDGEPSEDGSGGGEGHEGESGRSGEGRSGDDDERQEDDDSGEDDSGEGGEGRSGPGGGGDEDVVEIEADADDPDNSGSSDLEVDNSGPSGESGSSSGSGSSGSGSTGSGSIGSGSSGSVSSGFDSSGSGSSGSDSSGSGSSGSDGDAF